MKLTCTILTQIAFPTLTNLDLKEPSKMPYNITTTVNELVP